MRSAFTETRFAIFAAYDTQSYYFIKMLQEIVQQLRSKNEKIKKSKKEKKKPEP